MMRFEFDSEKDQRNRESHGIDFEEAQDLWKALHVIVPARKVRGERRLAILGKLRNKVFMAVFAKRRGTTRIISCHRADKKKTRKYYEKIKAARKENEDNNS